VWDALEVSRAAVAAAEAAVHADDLQPVARLALVDEVVLEHDLDAARELACRRALGHLLNRDHLVVHESRQAVLDLERVVVGVGLRVGRRRDGCARGGGGREAVRVQASVEVGRRRAVVHRLLHLWSDEVACETRMSIISS